MSLARPRRLAVWLVANGLLLGALLWSIDDPLTIRVTADGLRFTASVVDAEVTAHLDAAPSGALGLYMEGEPRRPRNDPWSTLLDVVVGAMYRLDADAGWQSVTLYDPAGSALWSHDFRAQGLEGWRNPDGSWWRTLTGDATSRWSSYLIAAAPGWRDGRLEATLQRGHGPVGLIARGADTGDSLLLMVRPHHRDAIWWRVSDGVWHGPIAGGAFSRPWQSAVKDLIRLFLRPYFLAMAAFGLLSLLGFALRRALPFQPRVPGFVATPLAVSLAIVALAASAAVSTYLLERIPHVQDSVAYLFQAHTFSLGRLWAPLPELPEFFEHEFVVMRDGRWFGKYPPGFPAVLALGVLAGAPWLVNPVAAGLAVLATYLLGARTAGPGVGLLAALLLATSPFFLFLGGSFMAHTTGLLFVTLFALAYASGRGFLAGLAFGACFLIRPWTALVMAIPLGIDLLRERRRLPPLALGALPAVAVFLAYNTLLAGDPLNNTMELWWSFDRLGFGADRGFGGHSPFNGLLNSLRNAAELSRHAFGWPAVLTFAFAFVPFVARAATRWDRIWLGSWFCLMLGYVGWWADGVMYGPRFYHEAMPFLALLTARGAQVLAQSVGAPGPALAALLLALPIAHNLALYLPAQAPLHRGYNYVSRRSLDAVESAGIRDALVFVDLGGRGEWWHYGSLFPANHPLLGGDTIYARDLGSRNSALMTRYPERRYYRLVRTSLEEIRP